MEEFSIDVEGVELPAKVEIPEGAGAIVVFAHGTGSSRNSSRNNFVASVLRKAGLGTVLFDLLVGEEVHDPQKRSDMDLEARRVVAVTDLVARRAEGQGARFGFFGSSTGAAAALLASIRSGRDVRAVVSRGGRPDLVHAELGRVTAATLLVVGELDRMVLEINRKAHGLLQCEKKLTVVEGASHLFEERGTLEEVAELTRTWFLRHLAEG